MSKFVKIELLCFFSLASIIILPFFFIFLVLKIRVYKGHCYYCCNFIIKCLFFIEYLIFFSKMGLFSSYILFSPLLSPSFSDILFLRYPHVITISNFSSEPSTFLSKINDYKCFGFPIIHFHLLLSINFVFLYDHILIV